MTKRVVSVTKRKRQQQRQLRLAWPLKGIKPFPPRKDFRVDRGYQHTTWNPRGWHVGRDLPGPLDTVLLSVRPGVITFRGTYGDLGKLIAWYDKVLDCTWGYAHCASFGSYKVEDNIGVGNAVARLGCTGFCRGPHVHVVCISGDFRFGKDAWGSAPYLDPGPLILEAGLRVVV